jgi:hypothetical protein
MFFTNYQLFQNSCLHLHKIKEEQLTQRYVLENFQSTYLPALYFCFIFFSVNFFVKYKNGVIIKKKILIFYVSQTRTYIRSIA